MLLAKERGWPVAVRSGGHAWTAWSVREGGLLIDLGAFRDIEYDDLADYQRNRDWVNEVFTYAQPVTAGQYLGDSDMTNRQLKFMAAENWERLQQIIAAREPEGRFHRYLAADAERMNINLWEQEVTL